MIATKVNLAASKLTMGFKLSYGIGGPYCLYPPAVSSLLYRTFWHQRSPIATFQKIASFVCTVLPVLEIGTGLLRKCNNTQFLDY